MKREYVKPVMESEVFVANEYVAACTGEMEYICVTHPGLIGNSIPSELYYHYIQTYDINEEDAKSHRIDADGYAGGVTVLDIEKVSGERFGRLGDDPTEWTYGIYYGVMDECEPTLGRHIVQAMGSPNMVS